MPTVLSLVTLQVFVMTACCATSDDKVVFAMTLNFSLNSTEAYELYVMHRKVIGSTQNFEI